MSRSKTTQHDSSDDEDDQARLLELLNAQCAASLGAAPVASTSKLDTSSDESDEDETDMSSEGRDEDDDEDEWTGFADEASSSSALANSKQPVVVSFEDSIRNGKGKFDESDVVSFSQKDGFMVRCLSELSDTALLTVANIVCKDPSRECGACRELSAKRQSESG